MKSGSNSFFVNIGIDKKKTNYKKIIQDIADYSKISSSAFEIGGYYENKIYFSGDFKLNETLISKIVDENNLMMIVASKSPIKMELELFSGNEIISAEIEKDLQFSSKVKDQYFTIDRKSYLNEMFEKKLIKFKNNLLKVHNELIKELQEQKQMDVEKKSKVEQKILEIRQKIRGLNFLNNNKENILLSKEDLMEELLKILNEDLEDEETNSSSMKM